MNVKVYYIIIVVLCIGCALLFTRNIRSNNIIEQLEERYQLIEASNSVLQQQNTELISNNSRIRAELNNSTELIDRAKQIIGEYQAGIADTTDTFDRIDRTIGALEGIILTLTKTKQDLKNSLNS